MHMLKLITLFAVSMGLIAAGNNIEEDEYGVKYATECELCKLVTKEVTEQLLSKSSHGVIQTGYRIDSEQKKTEYNRSELRLLETLENVCNSMLDYRVHKERSDSTRWSKSMSDTFKSLHGLVNKGVKVDIGLPLDLWDVPSVESAQLRLQCQSFIEDYEDDVNDWYFGKQEKSLKDTLCHKIVKDKTCLTESYGPEPQDMQETQDDSKQKSTGKKGDTGKRKQKKENSEL